MTPIALDIRVEDEAWEALPERDRLAEAAVGAALRAAGHASDAVEVSLLFTGDAEIGDLNRRWRGKERPTNVLSFPAPCLPAAPGAGRLLGDIVLAWGAVAAEAAAEGKPLASHVSHLIVHGMLHLLGYEHGEEAGAEAMRSLETAAQRSLGFGDPYGAATRPERRRQAGRAR